MRNLKCIQRTRYKFQSELPCTASTWDTVNDAIIYTLGPCAGNASIELYRVSTKAGNNHEPELLASWDASCPLPDLVVDEIVSLHHLVSSETTCLVLAGGDIIVVRIEPLPSQEKIEIIGSVDVGITAASWSPDEDLLVIATRENTLLYMSASFDNTGSASFTTEDAKLSKQVSVGWGKSETQFKGKRARALRDPTVPEKVDEGTPSENDRGEVAISWRGDGAFLAVNTIQPQGRRMIRVFSREGVLDSVSEAVNCMEGALAWKPSGQLIASIQRDNEDVQVVFFERNGLRHGEFSLRLDSGCSQNWAGHITLDWNVDSTVLAIGFFDRIQLWTMGNYHYYLKQEIHFGEASQVSPMRTVWHPEDPLRLITTESRSVEDNNTHTNSDHSITRGASHAVSLFRFISTLPEHPTVPPHDLGTIAVIDGYFLRVSPLRTANVPPPLALHEVTLPEIAIDVAVSPDNSLIGVLHHNSISLFDCDHKRGLSSGPSLSQTFTSLIAADIVAIQIAITEDNMVLVLLQNLSNKTFSIYDPVHPASCYYLDTPGINALLSTSVRGPYCWALEGNTLTKFRTLANDREKSFTPTSTSQVFPTEVLTIKVWSTQDKDIAFGLTGNGTLYANRNTLLRNCTSFLLTDLHLVITTTTHLLKFIHLSKDQDLEVPLDEPEIDERCRNIERGARLVSVMPTTYAVVLQMPRGNLETIYPRALVLAGIRRSIDSQHYNKAFLACRNHRVDMNILHDYKPEQFHGNVGLFVKQLNRTDFIDLFLSSLRDEDVSQTLYRNTVEQVMAKDFPDTHLADESTQGAMEPPEGKTANVFPLKESKVNHICDALLTVFKSMQERHLQNMITAHVCKNPPDIQAGLTLISGLGDPESDRVESAVEHICFLTDVNMIYDTALGMYNLEIALAVAQQSQKDPREYLPYLQNLESFPIVQRKFQIDDDLRRYSKALSHLHEYAGIERIISYTEKHELYREALELNKYNKGNHEKILRAYADFMNSRNRFHEAAIAFESLSDYAGASAAYSSAQMWRESLSSAYLARLSPANITVLAQSLADTLIESRNYHSAATILSQHLNNIPDSARTYCKGYHFPDAIRLLALNHRDDLIPDIIDAELAEGFSTLTELISECKGQLQAQVPRLRQLREKKRRDPLAFFEGAAEAGAGGADIPDNISLAPSDTSTAGGTLLTRYTGRVTGTVATGASRRTSKNRRREERKRARGKKGSVYEEEYLINSVGRLVERVNETSEDVRETVETSCRRGMWERARALESGFRELVVACEKCIPEVWEVAKQTETSAQEDESLGERPVGADGVLWDSIEEARRGRMAPTVKPFAGSALLNS